MKEALAQSARSPIVCHHACMFSELGHSADEPAGLIAAGSARLQELRFIFAEKRQRKAVTPAGHNECVLPTVTAEETARLKVLRKEAIESASSSALPSGFALMPPPRTKGAAGNLAGAPVGQAKQNPPSKAAPKAIKAKAVSSEAAGISAAPPRVRLKRNSAVPAHVRTSAAAARVVGSSVSSSSSGAAGNIAVAPAAAASSIPPPPGLTLMSRVAVQERRSSGRDEDSGDEKPLSVVMLKNAQDVGPCRRPYVISMDNEMGRHRRKNMRLAGPFLISPGVEPSAVPKHVVDRWFWGRMGTERNRALQGAFVAHWKLWMQVASKGDVGALVLEDDCVQYRDYPSPSEFPTDGITLLGGCFKGWGKWGVGYSAFVSSHGFLKVLAESPLGIQPLPQRGHLKPGSQQASKQRVAKAKPHDEMKWAMCVAYWIPPGMATHLCDLVSKAARKTFRSPDIWLAPLTKYFLWPPAFGDQGAESQCFTHASESGTDLYANSEMRGIAEKIGRPLPHRGCSREDVLIWQLQEMRHMQHESERRA